MTCTQIRGALGVYVVGAIEPAERSQVDRHVAFCPSCRDELAGLAGLPALLGRVTEEQIAEIAEPREELFENVLAEVVAERRSARRRRWRRRGRVGFGVAVPIAAATAVFMFFQPSGTEPAPRPVQPRPVISQQERQITTLQAHESTTGVDATVGMTEKKWGTALTARISGVPMGTSCKIVAVPRRGKPDDAASWRVTYPGSGVFAGSTRFSSAEIVRIEIRTTDDKETFVTLPVH